MARFKADEADHYGGQGGAGYFSLKNDKDVARVRFMYSGLDDVEGYAVHEVEIDGRKRYVNCIREYNEPKDNCPFCRAGRFQAAKLFIPIYNIDEDRVQVWERGKKFFGKLTSLASRYPDICAHEFEIERNGKPGSTDTTYEIFEVKRDDTRLEDLPDKPVIIGGLVLDKSAEDMEFYLENGYFPSEDDPPVRRRTGAEPEERQSYNRRTPATNRTRVEDKF